MRTNMEMHTYTHTQTHTHCAENEQTQSDRGASRQKHNFKTSPWVFTSRSTTTPRLLGYFFITAAANQMFFFPFDRHTHAHTHTYTAVCVCVCVCTQMRYPCKQLSMKSEQWLTLSHDDTVEGAKRWAEIQENSDGDEGGGRYRLIKCVLRHMSKYARSATHNLSPFSFSLELPSSHHQNSDSSEVVSTFRPVFGLIVPRWKVSYTHSRRTIRSTASLCPAKKCSQERSQAVLF